MDSDVHVSKCIDDQEHLFKTCWQCSGMICRRCGTLSYDFKHSLLSSYGDFSGTSVEYDRYCDVCDMLVKRGNPTVYPHSFKSYEEYAKTRIERGDLKCRLCRGIGVCSYISESHQCPHCNGTGIFTYRP